MNLVYLDNAASTRPALEVQQAVARTADELFANPASAHAAGAAAARALEQARADVAHAVGAVPDEVVFTSGGTESNALGLLGAAARARGRHLVVSAIEHRAVLRNVERLASEDGFATTVIPVGPSGTVDPRAVAAAIRPDTAIVAVMLVNNELGTVQPIEAIAGALDAYAASVGGRRPHLHVDAVQGFAFMPLRARRLGADSIAISGHKIHGPKGIGALWLRRGAAVRPLWDGGGQERGLRSGTENLPGAVGLACAAVLATAARDGGAAARIAALRDRLEALILATIPDARPTVVAGAGARAPHISSVSVPGLPAEPLLHALGARGVLASAGSACASKTRGPSHVLKAVGVDDDTAVIRFSLSRATTPDDVEAAARAFADAVSEIRRDLA
jgi:cysteine desulfurase